MALHRQCLEVVTSRAERKGIRKRSTVLSDSNSMRGEVKRVRAGFMLAVGAGELLQSNWEKIEAMRASMQMPEVGAALWINHWTKLSRPSSSHS